MFKETPKIAPFEEHPDYRFVETEGEDCQRCDLCYEGELCFAAKMEISLRSLI